MCMQKLKPPRLKTQSLSKVRLVQPGEDQNIALLACAAARNSAFLMSACLVHSASATSPYPYSLQNSKNIEWLLTLLAAKTFTADLVVMQQKYILHSKSELFGAQPCWLALYQ